MICIHTAHARFGRRPASRRSARSLWAPRGASHSYMRSSDLVHHRRRIRETHASQVRRVVRCAQDAVHNCRRRGARQTKPAAAVWSPMCPASPSGSIHGPASRKSPESGRGVQVLSDGGPISVRPEGRRPGGQWGSQPSSPLQPRYSPAQTNRNMAWSETLHQSEFSHPSMSRSARRADSKLSTLILAICCA